jgi:hypothetical protein
VNRPTARASAGGYRVLALAATLGLVLLAGCGGPRAATGPSSAVPSTPASASPTQTTPPDSPSPSTTPGPNVIAHPADGETVHGPAVQVSGVGTAFEANLVWEVTDAATHESVSKGFTTAGANGAIGPFHFAVTLDPDDYELEIWEPDVSGLAVDPHHNSTSVTFTVG